MIKTYNEVQNCQKTAEICNIHVSSVYNILKSNNVLIKSAQEIAKEHGKTIAMLDMNLNVIKIFSSLADAARFIKPSVDQKSIRGVVSHIRDVAKGKRKTAEEDNGDEEAFSPGLRHHPCSRGLLPGRGRA